MMRSWCVVLFFVVFYAFEVRADDAQQIKARIVSFVKTHEREIYLETMKEFENMDVDGSGYVSEMEFINFQSYGSAEQKSQAFKAMDANHNGKLTRNELWGFMRQKIHTLK